MIRGYQQGTFLHGTLEHLDLPVTVTPAGQILFDIAKAHDGHAKPPSGIASKDISGHFTKLTKGEFANMMGVRLIVRWVIPMVIRAGNDDRGVPFGHLFQRREESFRILQMFEGFDGDDEIEGVLGEFPRYLLRIETVKGQVIFIEQLPGSGNGLGGQVDTINAKSARLLHEP